MAEGGKRRRIYRSEVRREGAERTRQRILDAADRCFRDRGYAATTVAAVAESANAAPETLYAVFGTKASLLEMLIRRAVRGSETEVLEQETPTAVRDAPDRETALNLFAEDISGRLDRVSPLLAVLAAAAPGDPALASLYRELHTGRLRNLSTLTRSLERLGELRRGEEEATETVWALASPELYQLLTSVRGWSRERYAAWLEESLGGLL